MVLEMVAHVSLLNTFFYQQLPMAYKDWQFLRIKMNIYKAKKSEQKDNLRERKTENDVILHVIYDITWFV